MVEFVSANPTGPLHAGHARGAVYGDALARLLERAGYEVAREFYINDRGGQMLKMGASMAAAGKGRARARGRLPGQYIAEWAPRLPDDADPTSRRGRGPGPRRTSARRSARSACVRRLVPRDVAGRVTAPSSRPSPSSGPRCTVDDRDGATWLRSTDFGDDKDRVLVKSDGELTYLLPDIAYHRDKFSRGFDLLINVWGADHHGYVPA
jgi:arginyl-tRNA synthetase